MLPTGAEADSSQGRFPYVPPGNVGLWVGYG
jgi:hypothetical protein